MMILAGTNLVAVYKTMIESKYKMLNIECKLSIINNGADR